MNSHDLYNEIIKDIQYLKKISPAYIQRRFCVEYKYAVQVISMLEEQGFIGPADGAKPRKIIEK